MMRSTAVTKNDDQKDKKKKKKNRGELSVLENSSSFLD
jgi:hypothetical protein